MWSNVFCNLACQVHPWPSLAKPILSKSNCLRIRPCDHLYCHSRQVLRLTVTQLPIVMFDDD